MTTKFKTMSSPIRDDTLSLPTQHFVNMVLSVHAKEDAIKKSIEDAGDGNDLIIRTVNHLNDVHTAMDQVKQVDYLARSGMAHVLKHSLIQFITVLEKKTGLSLFKQSALAKYISEYTDEEGSDSDSSAGSDSFESASEDPKFVREASESSSSSDSDDFPSSHSRFSRRAPKHLPSKPSHNGNPDRASVIRNIANSRSRPFDSGDSDPQKVRSGNNSRHPVDPESRGSKRTSASDGQSRGDFGGRKQHRNKGRDLNWDTVWDNPNHRYTFGRPSPRSGRQDNSEKDNGDGKGGGPGVQDGGTSGTETNLSTRKRHESSKAISRLKL